MRRRATEEIVDILVARMGTCEVRLNNLERSVAPEEAADVTVDDVIEHYTATEDVWRGKCQRAERELAEARAEVGASERTYQACYSDRRRLERELESARVDRASAINCNTMNARYRDQFHAERDAARDDATRLRLALEKYGRHMDGHNPDDFVCDLECDTPGPCTCGLRVALDGAAT